MGTQNNVIIIGAIGLALVVALFLIFRNFDLSKIGEDISKGVDKFVSDTTKGFEDFSRDAEKGFNEFVENTSEGIDEFFNPNSEEKKLTKETLDIFQRQVEAKEQQAKDAGFGSVESFEKFTDPNSIFNAVSDDDLRKFNPPNTIGFGILDINSGRGIEDTPDNREKLLSFLSGDSSIFSTKKDVTLFNFPQLPQAFADSTPEQITVIDGRLDANRPLNLSGFSRVKPQLNTRTTTVRGTAKSELDTSQTFEVFGHTTGNRKVTGVIRETPKDPRKLRVNSNNRPTETASQRANRVFIEQGKFAGEGRGFKITSAEEKTKNVNFGTNSGRGLSIATGGKTTRQRVAERKRLAEEKAKKIFDSGSINNF